VAKFNSWKAKCSTWHSLSIRLILEYGFTCTHFSHEQLIVPFCTLLFPCLLNCLGPDPASKLHSGSVGVPNAVVRTSAEKLARVPSQACIHCSTTALGLANEIVGQILKVGSKSYRPNPAFILRQRPHKRTSTCCPSPPLPSTAPGEKEQSVSLFATPESCIIPEGLI